MTREQLQSLAESLTTWLTRDPLALGLVSAALVLIMLALALRWTLGRPARPSRPVAAANPAEAAVPGPVVPEPVAMPAVAATAPATMDALPARVERLADEVRALRRQLADTEALLKRQADKLTFMERQQLLQPAANAVAEESEDGVRQAGYEQAMMLAAHGVPVQELMAQCGLTRPEAQLIVLLHGRGGQA